MTSYRIHPAIGVARVGDSPEYYLAPETAGGLPTIYSSASTNLDAFRDKDGKLLKQGVRFKVFRYDDEHPDGVEVKRGQDGVKYIRWFVYPANKKASWFQFQQQTGSAQGPYPSNSTPHPEAPYAFVNDKGYDANNAANPYKGSGPTNPDAPSNPLRYNLSLGTSEDPATINNDNRRQLILDPGYGVASINVQRHEFTLSPSDYPFLSTLVPNPISSLGSILVDGDGNLIFLPGDGNSGTTSTAGGIRITHYANNEGWFDDTCDGPVQAQIVMDVGGDYDTETAWVVAGPPAYAPQVLNQVTMYDNVYDIFVRKMGANPALYSNGQFNASYTPSYPDEIAPILNRPDIYQYVCNIPVAGTKPHRLVQKADPASFKETFFGKIRQRGLNAPDHGVSDVGENKPGSMPFLAGDNPISNLTISKYLGLTETQYFFLSQYSKGLYAQDPLPALGPGAALDKAALSNCVGGAFSPGIEITWITRSPTIFRSLPSPFRPSDFFRVHGTYTGYLHHGQLSLTNGSSGDYNGASLEPGDLTKYMAQPWQADFNECSLQDISNGDLNTYGNPPTSGGNITNYWWWPAQRPYSVFPQLASNQQLTWTRGFIEENGDNLEPSDIQMVTCWKYLGFIVESGQPAPAPRYWEISRQTDKIDAYTQAHS